MATNEIPRKDQSLRPHVPHLLVIRWQRSEIERLELMIAEAKNSIEKYKGQGVSTDTQRKKVLRGLEEQLSITEVSSAAHFSLLPNPIQECYV